MSKGQILCEFSIHKPGDNRYKLCLDWYDDGVVCLEVIEPYSSAEICLKPENIAELKALRDGLTKAINTLEDR